MGKRYALVLFWLAIFIAIPAFAQIAVVSDKDTPRVGKSSASRGARPFPWKTNIVTTVFWIGEQPGGNNLVPNRTSAWDKQWTKSYGGFDDPNPAHRRNSFRQNLYRSRTLFTARCPTTTKHILATGPRRLALFRGFKRRTKVRQFPSKDRWVAIRKGNRVAYAQWEDAGPFRTDHWQYVFGNERPKPNLNQGAGLDVSPAVHDYLGLKQTDVTDWRFVELGEVPHGPWASLGENNTFVINSRKKSVKVTERLDATK